MDEGISGRTAASVGAEGDTAVRIVKDDLDPVFPTRLDREQRERLRLVGDLGRGVVADHDPALVVLGDANEGADVGDGGARSADSLEDRLHLQRQSADQHPRAGRAGARAHGASLQHADRGAGRRQGAKSTGASSRARARRS